MKYKVLCITRHSMRGVDFVNSQNIKLPNDIYLPNPFISWSENLSDSGSKLINFNIIENTLKKINKEFKNKKFWKEIRVDFLSERTYETGKIISNQTKLKIPITAVIDKLDGSESYKYSNSNYDSVTNLMSYNSFETNVPSKPSNINANILQEKTRIFLTWLNKSLNNKPFIGELPPVYDENNNFNSFYTTNLTIAIDLMIMLAYNKSPLNQLYKNNKKYKYQYKIITSGSNLLTYTLPNIYPKQYNVYNSLPIIRFLDKIEYGSGKIIVTHDIRQSQLLDSLDIKPYKYDFPFQNYIIIQTEKKVYILYISPKLLKNKCTFDKNKYMKKLIWKGSLDEWNRKIDNMKKYLDTKYPEYEVKESYPLLI